jgi:outer membrane protein TolC
MKKTKYLFCIAFILKISTAYCQESVRTTLSYPYLEKLIQIAKERYPLISAKQSGVELAKNNINKTGFVSYLDALSVSYYYRPKNSVDIVNLNILNGYQVGVNLNIGSIVSKPFAHKEAKIQYKIAMAEQKGYEQEVEAEVKKRYFAYIDQITQLKLRSKSYNDAMTLVKEIQHKFEKGERTFEDYTKSLALSTEQNQFMITAETGSLTAKASLEELLGEKLENIK